MQNRLKDRDRGGYTSDRYRPHDNYTNAFNMLAQIGLAEKEVTNSMRNAVTQAANVKALQDRLKFDVSSYSAKLKQLALDYSTAQQMEYENFIQTYMDSNEEKRRKELEQWAKDNEKKYDKNEAGKEEFKKEFNKKVDEYKEMDRAAAEERYKLILDIIKNHSDATQEHIKEFDNVFGFYSNNSDVSGNIESQSNGTQNNPDVSGNKSSVGKIIGSLDSQDNYDNDPDFIKAVIKTTNDIIRKFFKNFEMDIDTAKKKHKAILDNINSHSKAMQEYIEEFDIGSSIKRTNAIIGKFFKNFFKGGQ